MKFQPYSLAILLLLAISSSLFAQQKNKHIDHSLQAGPDGIVRCASMEVDAVRRLNNPNLGTLEQFEEWLAPKVKAYRKAVAEGRNPEIITIPLVVHVLHNGEAVGTAPNITDSQVLSQVQVLNEDFRRIFATNGWNDHPVGADVEIEFCPATVDPWGQPTNGVNHVDIGQDGATRDDIEGTIKPSTIWDPTKYMNMWSVKFAAPDDNLLGYAQFPEGSGLAGMPASGENPLTDGVVIRFEAFGTKDLDDGTFILMNNYDLGRTATHEVGHWVGLRHIWGDGLGCNLPAVPPGCSCGQDDYCEDTPNQEGARYSCDDVQSICTVPPTDDMKENYMDYSNDGCMNIFTQDQKARVHAVMANSPRRMELVNSTACSAPVPRISFDATNTVVTEGSSCEVKTIDIQLNISQAPTVDVTVSFSLQGTAGQGVWNDFTFSPTTVVFPANSASPQLVTVTIYEDAEVEADEFFTIEIDEVTTTGNALADLTNQRHTVTILDDDRTPMTGGSAPNILIFTENFNTLGLNWTTTTTSGSAVTWKKGTPPLGLGGNFNAYISPTEIPGNLYLYDPNAFGSTRLETPSINAGAATNLQLTFTYTCFGEAEYDFGTLWYSKNGGSWVQFGPAELSGQPIATTLTVPLPADANNTADLRIGFQWDNDELLGGYPPFSFDNVELRATAGSPATVQTDVNLGNDYDSYLGPHATVHFFDPTSGKIMATVQNNGSYDYGCATLAIDRSAASAGAPSAAFWKSNPANALLAKSFLLETENTDAPSDNTLTVTLFYKKSEVTAWEIATQQSRNSLQIAQVDGAAIGNVTPSNYGNYSIAVANGTLTSFTSAAYRLSATLPGNIGGYGAGVPGAAPVQQSLVAPGSGQLGFSQTKKLDLRVFPNPVNGELNVVFSSEKETPVQLQLLNHFGQTMDLPTDLGAAQAKMQTAGLPEGMYYLVLRQGDLTETRKVVVRH